MNHFYRTTIAGALLAFTAVAPSIVLAASGTAFASLDSISITTTGTASAALTGSPFDIFSALADTTAGSADGANDGTLFESVLGPFGEGTAAQGPGSATSFATVGIAPIGMAEAMATTFQELEFELAGTGDIIIDVFYTLDVDIVDSAADGFATAGITASSGFVGPLSTALEVFGGTPFDFATDSGVLSIVFFFDDGGFGPAFDFLTVETFAAVKANAVPLPAAAWLLGGALATLVRPRRNSAAV